MRATILLATALLAVPAAAMAQGVTQSKDGLATATQGRGASNNDLPAGSVNAETGPQSRPAYPSGSDTPNPGAAFVRSNTPVPASGPATTPSGILSTTTVTGSGDAKVASPGVGQAATPPPAK